MTRHERPAPCDELLHPAVGRAHVLRLPPHRPLRQAVRGPHHLPRHPDQRRRRQRGHGPAAVPAVDGPRPRHQHLHQQPRWLVHRADGDLRHDALHQARRADGLPRPGRLGRRGPARRRHPGQAARAAQQPDPDPPALHRGHRRPDLRPRDPGQRDPAHARAAREDDRRPQRPRRSRRSAATSSATRSSPPTRRSSTASSTRCSSRSRSRRRSTDRRRDQTRPRDRSPPMGSRVRRVPSRDAIARGRTEEDTRGTHR